LEVCKVEQQITFMQYSSCIYYGNGSNHSSWDGNNLIQPLQETQFVHSLFTTFGNQVVLKKIKLPR
jgi:hypothetical protein